jgi:DNA-binding CsgD family transcriptional regulator
MIELHIGYGHSMCSIARAFRISDRTVRYYMNKHYYGFSRSQYKVISKESKLNDREDL